MKIIVFYTCDLAFFQKQVKSLPTGHDPVQCPRLGARRAHQRAPGPGSRCGRSEIVVAFVSLGAGYLLSSGAKTPPTMFKLPIYRERLAYFLRLWAFIKLNIVESPPIDAADTALKTTKAWVNAADTAPLSFISCCIRFFLSNSSSASGLACVFAIPPGWAAKTRMSHSTLGRRFVCHQLLCHASLFCCYPQDVLAQHPFSSRGL